jgi:hypothetical protein
MIYLNSKFPIYSYNSSSVAAIRLNANYTFHAVVMLLLYI